MAEVSTSTAAAEQDANDVVRAFAANAAFRAATAEELTTADNPYRRPVRPADLEWLDYSRPMPEEKALLLSALLGHRMLRNAYDADLVYLAPRRSEAADADAARFYSVENRVLAARAAPILERHLFTFVDERVTPLPAPARDEVEGEVAGYHEQRASEPGQAFEIALSRRRRRDAATFLLLQLSAFAPAIQSAIARSALGEYDLAHPRLRRFLWGEYERWADRRPAYAALLTDAGVSPAPAAHWQFYLGSSLARGNLLHRLARDHERLFELLGALVQTRIDEAVTRRRYADVVEEGLDVRGDYFRSLPDCGPDDAVRLVDELVSPLERAFGPAALEGFHRGFLAAAHCTRLWDRDLSEQLRWADDIERYRERAERIQARLERERIEVDLDTFVESCEETSTTHVHDEHRLVMVESGQMHFWNNVTHQIALAEGDKLLIPSARLHGSVVLSGSCTYHQPIIPDDLLRQL